MTAPKIDTGAPDTSRAYIERMIQCAPFADQTAGIPEMVAALRALLAERDLAAAQTAAAVMAMRELAVAVIDNARLQYAGKHMPKHDQAAIAQADALCALHNVLIDVDDLPLPADAQAALDRLITEARRLSRLSGDGGNLPQAGTDRSVRGRDRREAAPSAALGPELTALGGSRAWKEVVKPQEDW